jgi:hypothetical protein
MSEFNLKCRQWQTRPQQPAVVRTGVSREARDDILLANAFAQQVAWGTSARGLEPDWFRNYWRNLAFLGFDGKLARGDSTGTGQVQPCRAGACPGSSERLCRSLSICPVVASGTA